MVALPRSSDCSVFGAVAGNEAALEKWLSKKMRLRVVILTFYRPTNVKYNVAGLFLSAEQMR